MFNNLIESSSHAREYKRRGSFLLFTSATYVVLLAIAAVASIYAYDARLELQTAELDVLTWVPPPPPEEAAPEIVRNTIRPAADNTTTPSRSTRTELIDSTSNPNNPPRDVGTVASNVPPARSDSVIGTMNADPPAPPGGDVRGTPGGTGDEPVVDLPDPPPAPTPAPVVPKILKVSRVLNSQALSLPQPNYPTIARNIRVQGTVIVQVLIDEKGNVVTAKATSGHPLLIPEAQKAALRARFSPTMLGDNPVKVQGVITYNFVLNN
jgi:periplasmic protein TonB